MRPQVVGFLGSHEADAGRDCFEDINDTIDQAKERLMAGEDTLYQDQGPPGRR